MTLLQRQLLQTTQVVAERTTTVRTPVQVEAEEVMEQLVALACWGTTLTGQAQDKVGQRQEGQI
jgi:hypothetical protein